MYIMYVDESGDTGLSGSPSNEFYLSAIIVHESKWLQFLSESITFRQNLKLKKGLLMKEEIHASEYLTKRIKLKNGISRNNRLDILKQSIDWLSTKQYLSIITVRVDKTKSRDPFVTAWKTLIQRFENTLKNQNFPNPAFNKDLGIIVADNTDTRKLKMLLRKMRKINFIPSMFPGQPARNIPLRHIIKDPIFRESSDSFLLQFSDVVVYFARQYFTPNKYIRQKAAKNYYGHLMSIINPQANRLQTFSKIICV